MLILRVICAHSPHADQARGFRVNPSPLTDKRSAAPLHPEERAFSVGCHVVKQSHLPGESPNKHLPGHAAIPATAWDSPRGAGRGHRPREPGQGEQAQPAEATADLRPLTRAGEAQARGCGVQRLRRDELARRSGVGRERFFLEVAGRGRRRGRRSPSPPRTPTSEYRSDVSSKPPKTSHDGGH